MTRGAQTPGAASAQDLEGVPVAGEVLASKYQVERVLGIGGMGVVVAARHMQLEQRVAIKFMRVEAAQHANGVDRFLREARAVVALSSEHVAKVLDVGTLESGAPYMVMEYLAGADLGEVLKTKGPLSVADTVNTVLQACEALAEAHMLGIVHRDLKPSNLFATTRRDGTQLIKVLDFGISKTVDLNNTQAGRPSLTASGLLIGSPLYMSPEQLRSAKAADARSDIWSLGVILFELLTGRAPFGADTLGETLARIIAEPAPPVRSIRADIPEGLAAVIAQCLERDLQRRIQSVAELSTRLAPYAPRESAISVERIARVSGSGSPPPGETRTAKPTPSPFGSWGHGSATLAAEGKTEPAWLKSGEGSADYTLVRRRRIAPFAIGAAIVVVAGGAGVTEFHGRIFGGDHASGSPPAQSVPVAAPTPSPEPAAAAVKRPTFGQWTPVPPGEATAAVPSNSAALAPLLSEPTDHPAPQHVADRPMHAAAPPAPPDAVDVPDAARLVDPAAPHVAKRKPVPRATPSGTAPVAASPSISEDDLLLERH